MPLVPPRLDRCLWLIQIKGSFKFQILSLCVVGWLGFVHTSHLSSLLYRKTRGSSTASRRTLIRCLLRHKKSWPPRSPLPQLLCCAQSSTSLCRRWITPTCSPRFILRSKSPITNCKEKMHCLDLLNSFIVL